MQIVKQLVSQTLLELGWRVQYSKQGLTPNKETWNVDIFAERNEVRTAINILDYHEESSISKVLEQQDRYEELGVRCAWLIVSEDNDLSYKLNSHYHHLSTKKTPVFIVKKIQNKFIVKNINCFYEKLATNSKEVYELSLELCQFTRFLFSAKIQFRQERDMTPFIGVNIVEHICSQCNKKSNVIGSAYYARNIYEQLTPEIQGGCITDLPQCDINLINQTFSQKFSFKPLEMRLCEDENRSYWRNSCYNCNFTIRNMRTSNDDSCTMVQPNIIEASINPEECFGESSFEYLFGSNINTFGNWFVNEKDEEISQLIKKLVSPLHITNSGKNEWFSEKLNGGWFSTGEPEEHFETERDIWLIKNGISQLDVDAYNYSDDTYEP